MSAFRLRLRRIDTAMDDIFAEMDGINLMEMNIMDLVDDENPEWTLAAHGTQTYCKFKMV